MTISVQLIIISVSLMIGVPVITVALMHSGMVKRIFSCHKEQETDGGGDGQDELPEVGRRFVEILGSMQVSCEELPKADGVDHTVSFEYQGGHFFATFRHGDDDPFDNTMSISYFNCFSMPAENMALAESVASSVNGLSLPVKCTFAPSDAEGSLSFSLHASGLRLGRDDASVQFVRSILICCFHLQRILLDRYESMRTESPSDLVKNRLIYGHQLYAMSRMEITDQPAPFADPVWHVADITIGEFLHTLFGYEISENSVLRLDGKEIASTPDTIAATALLAPVVAGDGPDAQVVSSRAVYSIGSSDREIREVMLNMAAERVDDRLISVRINAMLSAMPMAPFRAPASEESMPQARTVILGVPCVTPEAFLAEAKYMASELDLLAKCKEPDAAYSLYWGKVLYTDGRHFEALHYLTNAFGIMSPLMENPDLVATDVAETFYEVCYFLGVVNCALGRYRDAYYFLDLIVNQNRIHWTEQYVLCLMAMRDPRCPSLLDSLRENIVKQRDEEDGGEHLDSLMSFIERQQIVLDIRSGNSSGALEKLRKMLEENPDNDFALRWLARLS